MKRELHWIYGMALFLAMGIVFLALFALTSVIASASVTVYTR